MKIKHIMLLMTSALAASSMVSCNDEPYVITAEEEYTRNFIKTFGLIDPNQDWNLAKKSEVTVKVGNKASHVKAYMKVGDKYYIVANLEKVTGTLRIPFDMPEGTTDLLVKIDGKQYYTSPGGTVDPSVAQSRSLIDPVEGDAAQLSWGDYRLFTAGEILPVVGVNGERWKDYTNGSGEKRVNNFSDDDPRAYPLIPEGCPENYENTRVILDFWFKHVDEEGLTVTPLYWNTNHDFHAVGIFYFVKDGKYCAPGTEGAKMVTQDLFKDKNEGGDKQLIDVENPIWNKIESDGAITVTEINEAFSTSYSDIQEAKPALFTVEADHPAGWGKWYLMTEENSNKLFEYYKERKPEKYNTFNAPFGCIFGVWSTTDYSNIESYGHSGTAVTGLYPFDVKEVDVNHLYAARGINIKVPYELEFGFYIRGKLDFDDQEGNNLGNFYSMSAYNCAEWQTDPVAITNWTNDANGDKKMTNKPFACTFKHPLSGIRFFAFEDAGGATDDWDLNDLVFGLVGNFDVDDNDTRPGVDREEEDEPYRWLLAVEDLGITDDFDFNDVIIGITQEVVEATDDIKAIMKGDTWTSTETEDTKEYCSKVTFKALAAGGTLPAYVYYNDILLAPNGDESKAEWHKWFGVDDYTIMINTGRGNEKTGSECVVYFGNNGDKPVFTLDKTNSSAIDGITTGFRIGISKEGEIDAENSSLAYFDGDKAYFVEQSEKGEAPQMFIIPDDNWKWPTERTHIQTCYSGFQAWVKDKEGGADWYKKSTGGSVCRPGGK